MPLLSDSRDLVLFNVPSEVTTLKWPGLWGLAYLLMFLPSLRQELNFFQIPLFVFNQIVTLVIDCEIWTPNMDLIY